MKKQIYKFKRKEERWGMSGEEYGGEGVIRKTVVREEGMVVNEGGTLENEGDDGERGSVRWGWVDE